MSIHVGDHVEWDSRQGHSTGVVEKELTSATKIKGYTARATEESPQFLVKSDATGAEAAHKPEALHKSGRKKSSKTEDKDKDNTPKKDKSKGKEKEKEKEKEKDKDKGKHKGKKDSVSKKKKEESKEPAEDKTTKKRKEHDKETEKEEKPHSPKKQKQSNDNEEEVHHYDLRSHPNKHELEDEAEKDKVPHKRSKVESKKEEEHKDEDTKTKKGHVQHAKSKENTPSHADSDEGQVVKDFHSLVNMSADEINKWLATKDSKDVGWKGDSGHEEGKESVGHASGKHIIQILHKKNKDFTDDDIQHMRKVRSYIKRHLAQKPEKDIEHTRWRYSLMNWGHDPTKD